MQQTLSLLADAVRAWICWHRCQNSCVAWPGDARIGNLWYSSYWPVTCSHVPATVQLRPYKIANR